MKKVNNTLKKHAAEVAAARKVVDLLKAALRYRHNARLKKERESR